MHDLVVRGGLVVDGTGDAPRLADVAIDNGRVTAVERPGTVGGAAETIDATDRIVTPGFVDIHCHYDGQATWDPLLEPSSLHGITTVVVGNCGVGFAPVAPDQHDWLIELMEGVEDIPGAALSEGISWGWESFPEYLDVLGGHPRAIDIAAQVPHGALRGYVMGTRGAGKDSAGPTEEAEMARLVREAVEAGAVGFSTNRLEGHRSKSGIPVPGTFADESELSSIVSSMSAAGLGTVEWVPNGGVGGARTGLGGQFAMMRRIAEQTRRPMIFQINQAHANAQGWRRRLVDVERMVEEGISAYPQVHGRGFCLLFGFDTTLHPFRFAPSWAELAALPFAQRMDRLSDPAVRTRLIAQTTQIGDPTGGFLQYDMTFSMGNPPRYEPRRDESMAAIAQAEGRPVLEVIYDHMLESDGQNLLALQIVNYAEYSLDAMEEMLRHPLTVLGGSDGGAHCATASDASMPTFMLTHWVRDRPSGRLPLELVVHKMSGATSKVYGMNDRGVLAPGKKADLNVIDMSRLSLHLPQMRYDLPAGGKRLVQTADGYDATVVSGQVIRRAGADTGARPGALVRAAR